MESIRVLQSTYENLYFLAEPVRNFLEEYLPMLSPCWKRDCVYDILKKSLRRDVTIRFDDLDICYLLKILTSEKIWTNLKNILPEKYSFFTKDNFRLLKKVKKIRNEIAHPNLKSYSFRDYDIWEKQILECANLFKVDLEKIKIDYHQKEKKKILDYIYSEVIDCALSDQRVKGPLRTSIENTKERLEKQLTTQGIIDFFSDALQSTRGKKICEELRSLGLKAFEDIKDNVKNIYYGEG